MVINLKYYIYYRKKNCNFIQLTGPATQIPPHAIPRNNRPINNIITFLAKINIPHPIEKGININNMAFLRPTVLIKMPINMHTHAAPRFKIELIHENSNVFTLKS